MLLRSARTTAHARRSPIPSAAWRCASASRFAAGITVFWRASPSDLPLHQAQDRIVEHRIRQQSLEPGVILLDRPQPLRIGHLPTTKLAFQA